MQVLPRACPSAENTTPQSATFDRSDVNVAHAGGLHARPSALVQSTAKRFSANIRIEFNGQHANAKSALALMGLGVEENDRVAISATGPDAVEAIAAVADALQCQPEPETVAEPSAAAPEARPAPVALAPTQIAGVAAAPGLALGRVVLIARNEEEIAELAEAGAQEWPRLLHGIEQVRADIDAQIVDARARQARHESEIFNAHRILLDDPELLDFARRQVDAGKSAGFAFRQAVRTQCALLHRSGVALLAEREADLRDLESRVLSRLTGNAPALPVLFERSILLADDLVPSDLTRLPRQQIAGIATVRGGATSHLAILARSMGIPALVAVGPRLLQIAAGQEVLLDANAGWLDEAPARATLEAVQQTLHAQQARRQQMRAAAADSAQTRDGESIEVAANIGSVAEAREGVDNGADAVGLTRTEFLFIERSTAPTLAQQRDIYQAILDALGTRSAIIRTIDIGGDKEVPYLPLPAEENPALGLRGIRTGLAQPELLDTQLRALLGVRPLARLRIMIPMVTDVSDLRFVRQRIEVLATEMGLAERPELGVMIEVPAAALLADQLAEYADFLSIGTNDLSQYTLAMDRCHPGLAARIDALHPALLRLIALTVENAARHGRWVGVCGALASDPAAVPVLIGLGVKELSVATGVIPEIKARVRDLNAAHCRREIAGLLKLSSASDIRARIATLWPVQ